MEKQIKNLSSPRKTEAKEPLEKELRREQREKLRISNRERYYQRANMWVKSANETEAEIRNFLFIFAVFLFTFSPVGITQTNIEFNRDEIFLVWGFLVLSLSSGLVHIILALKFYVKIKDLSNQLEGVWSRFTYPSEKEFQIMLEESGYLNEQLPSSSNMCPLILQGVFLVTAFIMILNLFIGKM